MPKTGNIFLVGAMGAGKSSIGRHLARQLARPFWDSDKLVEQRTGVDIRTIFEFEGESGFRHRESCALDELTRKSGIVLATGGGAVLCAQNREWLRTRGFVVYLCASVETQLRRTARDRCRPLLQTADRRKALTELLQQRDPLYREIAHMVIKTDRQSIPSITRAVLKRLPPQD
ncbi:MAG TPA: shikimate kinase AroK [Gammaproteobacteria bacterium]|jgi:shikimate kinase|nr:shikimate kinase AroK [Gammaproteobacteria bacterium]